MTDLVRIEGVPVCAVGTYDLSTGPATFTEEDLIAAVRALDDPAVKVPRIKIDGLSQFIDPGSHGGEPAFGYLDAMHVSDDGQTLYADYLVHPKLAEDIDWAYPSRSIEGGQGWKSPTGKTHDLVITAVALLGVDLPGVSILPDLAELVVDDAPTLTAAAPKEVLARMPRRPGRIAAGLDEDLVRRRFYEWIEDGDAELPGGATPWDIWITSTRFDDTGVCYLKCKNEADGRLYRIDFNVARSEVTFAGLVEVVEQDVAVTASTRRPAPALAVWASREQSREGLTIKAAVRPNDQEETTIMDVDTTLLRRRLGLPEDATEDQIREALAAEPAPDAPENEGGDPDPAAEGEPAPEPEPAADPIAAKQNETISHLSKEVADLKARGARQEAEAITARRDDKMSRWLKAGQVAPYERRDLRDLLDADEDRVTAMVEARAPGSMAPIDPISDSREISASAADDAAYKAYMRDHHGIEVS